MPHGAYTRKALNTKPVTRNPLLLYGIEKSLWFAICYMDENHLFRRSKLDAMITDDKIAAKLFRVDLTFKSIFRNTVWYANQIVGKIIVNINLVQLANI